MTDLTSVELRQYDLLLDTNWTDLSSDLAGSFQYLIKVFSPNSKTGRHILLIKYDRTVSDITP